MNYMKITDAVNDGLKKLVTTLPADIQKRIKWTPTDDIADCFKSLADVLMYVTGIESRAQESLYRAHANDSFTAADNMSLVMDILVAAAKKADKNNNQNPTFAGIPNDTDENS